VRFWFNASSSLGLSTVSTYIYFDAHPPKMFHGAQRKSGLPILAGERSLNENFFQGALTGKTTDAGGMFMFSMKRSVFITLVVTCLMVSSAVALAAEVKVTSSADLKAFEEAVKKEEKIVSYGLPDNWANWGESWQAFTKKHGLKHEDTDMSSAEEIAKFAAEKNHPIADIGDIGILFAPEAIRQGVVQPYKNSRWADVPNWAKDPNGNWCAWYTGTMAFVVRTDMVKHVPHTWKDLLKPEYLGMIAFGDPRQAANANWAVFAAAVANGGSEQNIAPGIDFFAKLSKSGNLIPVDPLLGAVQKGEAPISFNWDFNGLGFRDKLAESKIPLEVVIPKDGTISAPYVSIINKWAPHPNAAKLWVEYVFSDAGQIALARGYARPIRSVKLPADVAKKVLPASAYQSVKPISDWEAAVVAGKQIAKDWSAKVMGQ
jgi:putative spermidine/putrescine transport system substrate-binding protein